MPGNESLIGTPRAARTLAHRILLVYNALVVFLLAGFMSVTQQKIIASMNARAFLEDLPAMPLSPELGLALPLASLFVLWAAGHLYRRDTLPRAMHWTCLVIEIVACLACMRSLNLAYDGVVLLVVADLMHRYLPTIASRRSPCMPCRSTPTRPIMWNPCAPCSRRCAAGSSR